MNGRSTYFLSFISALRKSILGHLLQQFNTHDHFEKLIYLSGKSHILVNESYLACGKFVIHKVIQRHYIWAQYSLHLIVQLIPLLIFFIIIYISQ